MQQSVENLSLLRSNDGNGSIGSVSSFADSEVEFVINAKAQEIFGEAHADVEWRAHQANCLIYGHLFLFESADVAVHFNLKLIAYWKQRRIFANRWSSDVAYAPSVEIARG